MLIDMDGLYPTKAKALEMQRYAQLAGFNPGAIYQVGNEWGFNTTAGTQEHPEVIFNMRKEYTLPSTSVGLSGSGEESYDGSTMKSSKEYDWSREEMPDKQDDDLNYIENGKNGNMFTRWLETIVRDWEAEENQETVEDLKEFGNTVVRRYGARRIPAGGMIPSGQNVGVKNKNSSKNEKHGDGGRQMNKSEKQI